MDPVVEGAEKYPRQLHRQGNLINSYLWQRQQAAGRKRDLFGLFSVLRSWRVREAAGLCPAEGLPIPILMPKHGNLLGGKETETCQPAAHRSDPSKSRHLTTSQHWDI